MVQVTHQLGAPDGEALVVVFEAHVLVTAGIDLRLCGNQFAAWVAQTEEAGIGLDKVEDQRLAGHGGETLGSPVAGSELQEDGSIALAVFPQFPLRTGMLRRGSDLACHQVGSQVSGGKWTHPRLGLPMPCQRC